MRQNIQLRSKPDLVETLMMLCSGEAFHLEHRRVRGTRDAGRGTGHRSEGHSKAAEAFETRRDSAYTEPVHLRVQPTLSGNPASAPQGRRVDLLWRRSCGWAGVWAGPADARACCSRRRCGCV